MTFALFAILTWKDAIPVKTQLFAWLAWKTIFIWTINAENASFSKVAPNAMTKDAFPARKTIFFKIMAAWLARINLTHVWNAQLMMAALTALMATSWKTNNVWLALQLVIAWLVTSRDSAQVARRLISWPMIIHAPAVMINSQSAMTAIKILATHARLNTSCKKTLASYAANRSKTVIYVIQRMHVQNAWVTGISKMQVNVQLAQLSMLSARPALPKISVLLALMRLSLLMLEPARHVVLLYKTAKNVHHQLSAPNVIQVLTLVTISIVIYAAKSWSV